MRVGERVCPVASLPHHGSHPISVQNTTGWAESEPFLGALGDRPFLQTSLSLPLKGAESCFLPVVSVLETLGAAGLTHLELHN